MPAGKLSIARQFPNPAADAIWTQDIELIRPIPVTREQIIKMGKDPDTVAKLEDNVWGLGDDAYVATLDVFHNLHCLNAERDEGGFYVGNSPQPLRRHSVSAHLVQLTADDDQTGKSNNLNLVTRHWTEGLEYPFPDFSIQAHCINFEKLTEWHTEASVDLEKYVRVMKKPPGVKERPTEVWHPEEWFERQNWQN
ncbi:hypothetical protein E4U12_004062 [Claviceps purpurea]|nr:hypothetical protein E4U12_004062 [Claviceps purpurea]